MSSFDPPNPRYKGNLLLRLQECYVLWAIGELPAKEASILAELTPKLRATFQKEGNWQKVLAEQLEYPPELLDQIRKLWNQNLEKARFYGVTLSAQEFAEGVADENLRQRD